MNVKVKILRATVVDKKTVLPKEELIVSKKEADYLIRTNKAELCKESGEAEEKSVKEENTEEKQKNKSKK